MPTTNTPYRIDECPHLIADACVGDEAGQPVFLSVWARDTAVQEFLARFHPGPASQGLFFGPSAIVSATNACENDCPPDVFTAHDRVRQLARSHQVC